MGEIELLSSHGHARWREVDGAHRPEMPTLAAGTAEFRLMEMEKENGRLQRLVAELLLKNQQLREGMTASADAGRHT